MSGGRRCRHEVRTDHVGLAAALAGLFAGGCGGSSRPSSAGLPIAPLSNAVSPDYAPSFSASGHGPRTVSGRRLTGHAQIVGSCSGGRDISVAFGAVKGEIFCNGSGTQGGVANALTHPTAKLVVRTRPGVRWAVLVASHS